MREEDNTYERWTLYGYSPETMAALVVDAAERFAATPTDEWWRDRVIDTANAYRRRMTDLSGQPPAPA